MNINDIDIFINALHNKSLKIKKSDCLEPIYPCMTELVESTPSLTITQPELVPDKANIDRNEPPESILLVLSSKRLRLSPYMISN